MGITVANHYWRLSNAAFKAEDLRVEMVVKEACEVGGGSVGSKAIEHLAQGW